MGNYYAGFRPGFMKAAGSLMANDPQLTYIKTLQALDQIGSAEANADLTRKKGKLLDDRMAARGRISGDIGTMKLPDGVQPGVLSDVLLSSDSPSLAQLAKFIDTYSQMGYRDQAAAGIPAAAESGDYGKVAAYSALGADKTLPAIYGVADNTRFNRYGPGAIPTDVGNSIIDKNHWLNSAGVFTNTVTGQTVDPHPYRMGGDGNVVNLGSGEMTPGVNVTAPLAVCHEMGLTDPGIRSVMDFIQTGAAPDRVPFAPGAAPAPVDSATLQEFERRLGAAEMGAGKKGAQRAVIPLSSTSMRVFEKPVLDEKGNPVTNTLTGQQTTTTDAEKLRNFNSWFSAQGGRYHDMNAALADWERLGEPRALPSQSDLEFTARKYGISVDEVKRRLGMQ